MKGEKLTFLVAAFVVAGLVLLTGRFFQKSVSLQETEPLKLGYIKVAAELPVFIAIEKGYFEEEGLQIELVELGYKEEVDALIRGDIDIIPATSLTLPFGVEVQSPGAIKLHSLGGVEDNDREIVEGLLVLEDSSVKTVEDLKNQKIGVPEGATDYFVMKTVLTKLGLEPRANNIQIVEMQKNLLPQSLLSKQIVGAYMTQPQLASVRMQTGARYLLINPRAKYVLNPFWSGGGLIRSDYLGESINTTIFKKYLEAIDKAIDFMREDPEQSKSFLVKYAGLEESIISEVGNYFKVKSNEEVDVAALQEIADIYHEVGILDKQVDVASMLFR